MQTIDTLIENAATTQSDQDYQIFFSGISRKELFFKISNVSSPESNDEIRVPTVSVGNHLNAVVFYTSPADDRLGINYAGIVWEKALVMVYRMSNVDALVVQSQSNHWVATTKEKIEDLLDQYR